MKFKNLNGFKERSKKFQTILEVLHKLSSKRIIMNCDKDIIKHSISLSLIDLGDDTQIFPESVIDIIFQNSKLFLIHDKIHLTIIWICVYDYSNNMENVSPLIKIYKNETKNCGIFIDVKGNVFMNWKHFLECAFLPTSMLCVPTNGEYTKMEDSNLDLTYFFYEDVQKAFKKSGENNLWPMNLPFTKMNFSLKKNSIIEILNQGFEILRNNSDVIQKIIKIVFDLYKNPKSLPVASVNLISSFIEFIEKHFSNPTSELTKLICAIVTLLSYGFLVML